MPPKSKKSEKPLEIVVEEAKMPEAKVKKPRAKKERTDEQVKADKEKMANLRQMKKKK
jgi:hypothetical protein